MKRGHQNTKFVLVKQQEFTMFSLIWLFNHCYNVKLKPLLSDLFQQRRILFGFVFFWHNKIIHQPSGDG